MEFFTKIVGVTFQNTGENTENRQSIISDLEKRGLLKFGQELYLFPDPNNPYDSNAVKVMGPDGRQLGNLSRAIASNVTVNMRKGALYKAFVQEVTGGRNGYNYGINIKVVELSSTSNPVCVSTETAIAVQSSAKPDFPIKIRNESSFHNTCWGLSHGSKMKLVDNRFVVLFNNMKFSSDRKLGFPEIYREFYTYDTLEKKIVSTQRIPDDTIYDFVPFPDGSIYYLSLDKVEKNIILQRLYNKNNSIMMRYAITSRNICLARWGDKLLILGNVGNCSKKRLIAVVDLQRYYTLYAFEYKGDIKSPWIEYYCINKDYLVFSIAEGENEVPHNSNREMYVMNLHTYMAFFLKQGDISNIHFIEGKLFYNDGDCSYSAALDFDNLKLIEERQITTGKIGTILKDDLIYTKQSGPFAGPCIDGVFFDADPSVTSQFCAKNYLTGTEKHFGLCDFEIDQAIYVNNKILISGTTPESILEQYFAILDLEEPSTNFENILVEDDIAEERTAEVQNPILEKREKPVQPKVAPTLRKEIELPEKITRLAISVINAPNLYGIGHAVRVKQINEKILIGIDFSQGKKERENMVNCMFSIDAFEEKLLVKDGDTPINFIKMLFSVIPELNLDKSESGLSMSELTEKTLQERYSSSSYSDKKKSEISELATLSKIKISQQKEEKTVPAQTKHSKKGGIQTVICPKCHSLVANNLSICPSCEAPLKNAIHFSVSHSDNPANTKNDDEVNWKLPEEHEYPKTLSDEYNIDDFESDYYETDLDKYYEEQERLLEDYWRYGEDW